MTSITVVATIDTRGANRGDEESQARDIDAKASTYEDAVAALYEQVPEGWLLVGGIQVPDRLDRWTRAQKS